MHMKSIFVFALVFCACGGNVAAQDNALEAWQRGLVPTWGLQGGWANDEALAATAEIEDLKSGVDPGDIAEIIEGYGYNTDILEALMAGQQYDLKKFTFGPGEIGFMASPALKAGGIVSGGAKSLIISPAPPVMKAGYFPTSGEDLRRKILQGIKLSLDASCSFPVRPTKIKATASAVVLSLELEWESGDICERLDDFKIE